jgi:hypothetical protein
MCGMMKTWSEDETANYSVRFGPIARTILYEDSQGVIRFCFDVNPVKSELGKWEVHLERKAHIGGTAESKRSDAAFERVAAYLVSRGYLVIPE